MPANQGLYGILRRGLQCGEVLLHELQQALRVLAHVVVGFEVLLDPIDQPLAIRVSRRFGETSRGRELGRYGPS